jgi:hypothetical protein
LPLHGVDLLLHLRIVGEGRSSYQEGRSEHRASQQHTQSSFDGHLNPLHLCKSINLTETLPHAGLFFGHDGTMTKVPPPLIRRPFTANRPSSWHICHKEKSDEKKAKAILFAID